MGRRCGIARKKRPRSGPAVCEAPPSRPPIARPNRPAAIALRRRRCGQCRSRVFKKKNYSLSFLSFAARSSRFARFRPQLPRAIGPGNWRAIGRCLAKRGARPRARPSGDTAASPGWAEPDRARALKRAGRLVRAIRRRLTNRQIVWGAGLVGKNDGRAPKRD